MKTKQENQIDSTCLAIWAFLILLTIGFFTGLYYAAITVYDFLTNLF